MITAASAGFRLSSRSSILEHTSRNAPGSAVGPGRLTKPRPQERASELAPSHCTVAICDDEFDIRCFAHAALHRFLPCAVFELSCGRTELEAGMPLQHSPPHLFQNFPGSRVNSDQRSLNALIPGVASCSFFPDLLNDLGQVVGFRVLHRRVRAVGFKFLQP